MRTSHIRTRAFMHSYSYSTRVCLCVHECTHVRTAGVRTRAPSRECVCVCVFKQAYLFTFASPKTHSHLNAGDRTHLPALRAARQLSQNILYTHARIRLPGVPHMQLPGSAKWNFFKSPKTLPQNKPVCLIIPRLCFFLPS